MRVLARVVGTLLVVAGVLASYWWFYRLAPSRRTLDPQWYGSHSFQEYWKEVQSGIRRGEWNHDDAWTVGMYGDETWAKRIMANVDAQIQGHGSCRHLATPCHRCRTRCLVILGTSHSLDG